jgi:hypothetical protein
MARRSEHHGGAGGDAAEGVRGRVCVVIGLDLDDDAACAAEQEGCADQFGRDLVDASGEEGFAQLARSGHGGFGGSGCNP